MAIIQVRRANVILDIPDVQKDEYLAKGFDIINEHGKIVEKATPNDPNALKKAYAELSTKVKTLEKENKELKEKLAAKASKPEEVKEVEAYEEIEEVEPEKPRRRRSKQ